MTLFNPYFDRDLSWLSFNERILQEAADPRVPLYDRVMFMGIYSGNLDEFFRVRVAALRQMVELRKRKLESQLDFDPKLLLYEVQKVVEKQLGELGKVFAGILAELARNNVLVYTRQPMPQAHQNFGRNYFRSHVLCFLQPVFMEAKARKGPFLAQGQLYFLLTLRPKGEEEDSAHTYAYLNIPSDKLPRLVELPGTGPVHYWAFLDEIIRANLDVVFPEHKVVNCFAVKLNRDEDLNIEDEYDGDLVKKNKTQLEKQHVRPPTRFLYDAAMPGDLLARVVNSLHLKRRDLVAGGRYHNLSDLQKLPNPVGPELAPPTMPPMRHEGLDGDPSLFESVERGDVLLHFPYESYDYVLRFFNEAAIHPAVKQIKVSLYRVARHSCIVQALISAARNGKKVTVFVEVKARFDEENNLHWAGEMKKAGIRVIYSIPGLKVHAKIALVRAKGPDGRWQQYAYLGTGNFNEATARTYADHGLMTCRPELTDEVNQVFEYLSTRKHKALFSHLLVSGFDMQEKLLGLMDREIAHAREGKPATIIVKVNNLEERVMIDKLCEAARAGVRVYLLVRSICCLAPGINAWSDNIRVVRLVDRFLEHARVYLFENDGQEALYLASADWMTRNLHRRIEVAFPVYDPQGRAEIKTMLRLQLSDNTKAVCLDRQLRNCPPERGAGESPVRAQVDFYEWLRDRKGREESTVTSLAPRAHHGAAGTVLQPGTG
jgi:polyphosphate kinase